MKQQIYRNLKIRVAQDGLSNVSAEGDDGTTYNVPCAGDAATASAVAEFRRLTLHAIMKKFFPNLTDEDIEDIAAM